MGSRPLSTLTSCKTRAYEPLGSGLPIQVCLPRASCCIDYFVDRYVCRNNCLYELDLSRFCGGLFAVQHCLDEHTSTRWRTGIALSLSEVITCPASCCSAPSLPSTQVFRRIGISMSIIAFLGYRSRCGSGKQNGTSVLKSSDSTLE